MSDTVIVIPCFDEADRLNVRAFWEFAAQCTSVDFVFVNDGSRDGTIDVLHRLAQCDPNRFAILNLERNCGKAEAVRQGLLWAVQRENGSLGTPESSVHSALSCKSRESPRYVGYWDADLATPLHVIGRFRDVMEQRPEIHLVLGSRVRLLGHRIERLAYRHFCGRLLATIASSVVGMSIYDTQCGAKLFRILPPIQGLFDRPFSSRWVFDVELLARWRNSHDLSTVSAEKFIFEFPLEEWRDVAGSKIRWRDGIRAFWDLAVLFWRYRLTRQSIEIKETFSSPVQMQPN